MDVIYCTKSACSTNSCGTSCGLKPVAAVGAPVSRWYFRPCQMWGNETTRGKEHPHPAPQNPQNLRRSKGYRTSSIEGKTREKWVAEQFSVTHLFGFWQTYWYPISPSEAIHSVKYSQKAVTTLTMRRNCGITKNCLASGSGGESETAYGGNNMEGNWRLRQKQVANEFLWNFNLKLFTATSI